jgi:hypothetical protein
MKDVTLSKNDKINLHVKPNKPVRKDLISSGTSSSAGVKRKLDQVQETEISSSSSSSGVGVISAVNPETHEEQLAIYNASQLAEKNLVATLDEVIGEDVQI